MDNEGVLEKAQGWPAAAKNWWDEMQAEMRRVTWPTRAQVIATTTVVLASIFLFSAYFFVVDFVIGKGINQLFHALARR